MNNLCEDCQVNEGHKVLSFMEALIRHFEKSGPISFNIRPRRVKSMADIWFHQRVKELGGIHVMLDGVIDYSTNPATFIPKASEISGNFSDAIILNDVHNIDLQEKE